MESLFVYLEKSSSLIGLFYLAYYFMLRKETFFNSNRWFLLTGLITSVILPLIVFKRIIWVAPSPNTIDWSKIPVTTPIENTFEINWYLIFGIVYGIGIVVFLLKFAFDFYSLSKILKDKTIQQQADFKYIDVTENISPFSYFNYIVYNSSLYSSSELENILEHEKVHSTQHHTADVLISRLFCIAFWYNPFIWFYKKAIIQNLEFIADSEATKNSSNKKAYQLTLLKITTHENCVAITNHFYQSLIKKRIVMLNKNQSNKRNSWKYALVLPLLGVFVFFFQVKVVAQEKVTESNSETTTTLKWTKNSLDSELEAGIKKMAELGVTVKYSELNRNENAEITAIKVSYDDGKGNTEEQSMKGRNPIKPIIIAFKKNNLGNDEIEFQNDFYNDVETNTAVPTAPVPPITPNIKNMPTPPPAPNFPAFPNIKMPKDPNDKKAIERYEAKMNKFAKKWESGAIKKYEAEMKVYEEKMKDYQPDMTDFNKKMTEYQDKMENYQEKLRDEIQDKQEAKRDAVEAEKDKTEGKNVLIIINGKRTEASIEDIKKVDPNLIQSMSILKGKNALKKYGKDGENGAIEIITKENIDLLKSSNKKE
ncbi:M56 family metallopeptidase [Flavobacterium sp.]|uniref:M56 family metallopeptidase n=1 Tax=Flavobacterium sp. TaxID=239 RepID=UPI0037B53FB8